jgi:CHAD domain-containing protein/CYTH domain-containing protein
VSKELSPDDLGRPAAHGAALVALRLLDEAEKRRDRLADPNAADALHDFRVALRRLRSWLRAYRPYLDDWVRRRTRRRLSRVADASNEGRDVEVQLEWLHEQRHALSAQQREGLDWLIGRLDARTHESEARLRRRATKDFDRASRALEGLKDIPPDANASTSLATATAALVREHAEDVRRHLAAVRSIADQKEAHAARIAGKRLRYLLEPFAELVPESKQVIGGLQEMQDAIGELHDSHVLMGELAEAIMAAAADRARRLAATMLDDEDPTSDERAREAAQSDAEPGLLTLARRARSRNRRAFSEVAERWLHGGADPLIAGARAVADRMEAIAAESTPVHREADQEIERKYLLRELPPEVGAAPMSEIEQGYLPGARVAERLRRMVDVDTGDGSEHERLLRTVKVGNGLSRTEIEEEMPRDVFEAMWPLTEGRRVRKRRYRVHDGPLTWEIDEFLDRELVIAEVELGRADAEVEIPAWLERHVVREVTAEPEYANQNLAR